MTMHRLLRSCRAFALLALAGGLLASSAQAQRNPSGLPAPRLFQVSPGGAKAGTTVELIVAGRHLEDPEKLVFSHPEIKAEYLPPPALEIDPKTKKPRPGMPGLPADHFKFKVTVPANVSLGLHDVRLVNKWGVSNPRVFVVGDLAEVNEKEPNSDVEQAQRVELNTTINGTIQNAVDVDYFVFKASKGQRVIASCLASSIDSRLQPLIEIYDKKDRQLAANRGYSGEDAVADFTVPEEGDYHVRIFQFTHTLRSVFPGGMPAGSSDYFYRLTITTAPWIDAVVPSVVEPGKTTTVTVYGRNLPGGKPDPSAMNEDGVLEKVTATITAPADARRKLAYTGHISPAIGWQDGIEFRLKNAAGSSNPFLISVAQAPVVLDQGDNDSPETAQEVPLPCELSGRVEKRRDRDWFAFTARRGETWNIEVISNRLGAPTYMMMVVRNPATKSEIYESPLNENTNLLSRKFFSRSEDPPIYRFTAPADGKYQLLVASRSGDTLFGPRHFYTVRISRDEPDFKLVAVSGAADTPDAPTLPAGGQEAFTVLVQRSEGFTGDVELTVEGLPPGVSCPPQILNAAVRETTVVLTATPEAAPWAGEIRIKGATTIAGNRVVREARAASIVWPIQPNQNVPTMSRLDRSLWLAVRGKAPFNLLPTIDKPEVLQGDKATVKIRVNRLWPDLKNVMQLSLMQAQNRQGSEVPTNLRFNNNQPINVNAGQAEATVNLTIGNDVPPGVYNVVFRGQTQSPYNKDPKSKARQNTFIVQPSAPLIVTVLPRSLAQLNLSANNANVKIGGQTEILVRVQRRFNYQGEFKVQLVLPAGMKGVEASDVTIPAGQNEAKLVLRAPDGTNPGARNNLIVKATALFNGKTPTTHETKLNVNVVK
jgi:hypothetical protein